ncbi:hypothetical protein WISP_37998 [Willisornis vidua]|uniref:Uncharacterized protein n=1 Tax=Willisornis vidua TaxID=1566151 RepID=A0ABQ9DMB9_9PASS|nr:hypothetical protein WISP_37998 [Willisornis vidua]
MDSRMGTGVVPSSKGQICGHLRNLNTYKSMGLDEMDPIVLRDSTEVVAKPLSMIYGDQRKKTLYPTLKRVERRTREITNLPASHLCLGRSWNKPPRSYAKGYRGQGEDSGQPTQLHQRENLPDDMVSFYDEEITSVDNGRVTIVIYLDFCKDSDMVNHNILLPKLERKLHSMGRLLGG